MSDRTDRRNLELEDASAGTDVDPDGVDVIPGPAAAEQTDDAAAVAHGDAEGRPVHIPEGPVPPEAGDQGQRSHGVRRLRPDVGERPRDLRQELRRLEANLRRCTPGPSPVQPNKIEALSIDQDDAWIY